MSSSGTTPPADGGLAMVGALGLILARRTLLAGDRLTVKATD
jgi:hypothetical protein